MYLRVIKQAVRFSEIKIPFTNVLRAHPQFTVLTHKEDNKFISVDIFQNIILYTNIFIYIYLYSIPSVESFIHVYTRK